MRELLVMKTREDIQEVQEFIGIIQSHAAHPRWKGPESKFTIGHPRNCFDMTELLNYGYHSSQAFLRFGCPIGRTFLISFFLCAMVFTLYILKGPNRIIKPSGILIERHRIIPCSTWSIVLSTNVFVYFVTNCP